MPANIQCFKCYKTRRNWRNVVKNTTKSLHPHAALAYDLLITSRLHFWLFCLRLSIHHYVKCTRQTRRSAYRFNVFKVSNCVTFYTVSHGRQNCEVEKRRVLHDRPSSFQLVEGRTGSMLWYDSYSFRAVAHNSRRWTESDVNRVDVRNGWQSKAFIKMLELHYTAYLLFAIVYNNTLLTFTICITQTN